MNEFDWSQFTVRVAVNVPVETLYTAWATRKGIEHWFLRMSEYRSADGKIRTDEEKVQKGDTYSWRWHGWPDEMEEHGAILDCNGKDMFQFSFGQAGICTISLKQENQYRVVELKQTEIPSDEHGRQFWHLGCKTGWTFYLANLKSVLEGGMDLRNRDEHLKNVVNS